MQDIPMSEEELDEVIGRTDAATGAAFAAFLDIERALAQVLEEAERPGSDPARPSDAQSSADAGGTPGGTPLLVGRREALDAFTETLDTTAGGASQILCLVGPPGTGKTRLLDELVSAAGPYGLARLCGRATEFDQETPFGVVVDALDDHLEAEAPSLPERVGAGPAGLLATVFPSLSAVGPGTPESDLTGLARYRLYRAVRQLLDLLAEPSGLVLVLDDVHWADEASVELLDYLLRHPPRGRVLIAMAYRPAQAPPRLSVLVEEHGRVVTVDPLTEEEVAEFLGGGVSRVLVRALYEASGGNPFYLQALARMAADDGPGALRWKPPETVIGGGESGDLPPAVRAALQAEMSGLSPTARLVAQAAAVVSDEFEPAFAAVAAQLSEDVALAALDEMVARDIVRPSASAGRFRFRHPLVWHATYESSAAGWRIAAHARVAAHMAAAGAPATARARHVERSGGFGDQEAIATLMAAARTVAPQAPATAAHWLLAAGRLTPADHGARLDLLLELARAQVVSGQIAEARDTGREVLGLLPADDYARRSRAAQVCAMAERMLGRPHQGRTLLLDELRRTSDPLSAAALRLRLVTDSLMRSDIRAAQAELDQMPGNDTDWEPSLRMATAAVRPLAALAALRTAEALRHIDTASRLVAAAPDEHLADWLEVVTYLCWTETMMGRHESARRRFERVLAISRTTGQSHIMPYLLAGQARTLVMLGELAEAAVAAEDAVEVGRLLGTEQELATALTQQALVASWSGDHEAALRHADEATRRAAGSVEHWGALARYARAQALVNAGRTDEGAQAVLAACDGFRRPTLDPATLMSCCELMAAIEAAAGRFAQATMWADRAAKLELRDVDSSVGLAALTRAHAERHADPAGAAERARAAAEILEASAQRIDAGRARVTAALAYAATGERGRAREELRTAVRTFFDCGARDLYERAVREQRRLGVRVPGPRGRREAGRGRSGKPDRLSPREREVAGLVVEGCTNQQIADKLVLSIRTVETHLSHIFAKLGVTSRVGVVKALGRGDADGR